MASLNRRNFIVGGAASAVAFSSVPKTALSQNASNPWSQKLVDAARTQIGVTTIYDPSYIGLNYPDGDIPRERGVCTDVIIRAYRDAFDIDLQVLIHEDMKRAFSSYPTIWGHKTTDRNIDHRRVPNIETFLKRKNTDRPVSDNPQDYRVGDLVTQRLPGNLPHIGVVSDKKAFGSNTPLLVHNVGRGTQEENILFAWPINGHFRFSPDLA